MIPRLALIALTWCGAIATADGEPPRVAIICDPADKNLAALVTSELSSNSAIVLVERDDMARIGNELKLQQLAGNDPVALGKLAGADGLLFLSKAPSATEVRFTAVGLGYALFDDRIADGSAPAQLAKSIAHRVADYGTKLKLAPARAVPISVLNLRADYASDRSAALERNLTLMLESRLSSVPEFVVLERRHAWSLGFERSLDPATHPLLQGAYLIDGSLSLASPDNFKITVQLRLRSPKGDQNEASISGPAADLSGLAEKIVAEIRQRTGRSGSPPAWEQKREAAEYLKEGNWAWQHGTPEEAEEAIDSAELLGETSRELAIMRMNLLCDRIGRGLDMNPGELPGALPSGSASLEERTDNVFRALELAARSDQGKRVVGPASKILFLLDQAGSPRADELRRALRPFTHYDPLHGSPGMGTGLWIAYFSDLYADEWSASLEEELAYYRYLCGYGQRLPPDLLTRHGLQFCPRFLNTPVEQTTAFQTFVESLKHDPQYHAAYLLLNSASPDPAVADPAFTAYIHELQQRHKELIQGDSLRPEWINARPLSPTWNSGVPPHAELFTRHASEMVPLLHDYLTHRDTADIGFSFDFLWQPEGWSHAEAAAIWPDYLIYRSHLAECWKRNGNIVSNLPAALAKNEDRFRRKFPDIAASDRLEAPDQPLAVTHFWSAPISHTPAISYGKWAVTEDSLWMHCSPGGVTGDSICRVHLPDLKTEVIDLPFVALNSQVRVSPGAVYADYIVLPDGKVHGLARYDLAEKTWTLRPIDLPFMQYFCVGKDIYFDVRSIELTKGGETGIARYDWASEKTTLLASSRRKPAQNQFDDKSGMGEIVNAEASDIFAGPGGRTCVTNYTGTFYLQDQPGNWPPVFDAAVGGRALTLPEGTLVATDSGEVVLLSAKQREPEYLLAPLAPQFRHPQLHPAKEVAPWAAQAHWDAPDHAGIQMDGFCEDNVGVHGDHLFLLVAPSQPKGAYGLLVYTRENGRTPRQIPLQFKLDAETANRLTHLSAGNDAWSIDQVEHPGSPLFKVNLIATNQGLCFHLYSGGIWFLPYQDIETYLHEHKKDQANDVEPAVVSAKSSPAPSTTADDLDPGNPESFR